MEGGGEVRPQRKKQTVNKVACELAIESQFVLVAVKRTDVIVFGRSGLFQQGWPVEAS